MRTAAGSGPVEPAGARDHQRSHQRSAPHRREGDLPRSGRHSSDGGHHPAAGPAARLRFFPLGLVAVFWLGVPVTSGSLRLLADHVLAPAIVLVATLLCALVARLERHHRATATAWLLLALANGWLLAVDLLTHAFDRDAATEQLTLTTDLARLGFHPLVLVAAVLLLRTRTPRWVLSMWWDGVVVGLAVLAVGLAALGSTATGRADLLPTVGAWASDLPGSGRSHPMADLILLAAVLGLATAYRSSLSYLWWIAAGIAATVVADMVALVPPDHPAELLTAIVHGVWLLAPTFIAVAAGTRWRSLQPGAPATGWTRGRRLPGCRAVPDHAVRAALLPTVAVTSSAVLIGLALAVDGIDRKASLTALGCVTIGLVRLGVSVWQLRGSIDALRLDRTDHVTGLANRQAVSEALAPDPTTGGIPILLNGRTPPEGVGAGQDQRSIAGPPSLAPAHRSERERPAGRRDGEIISGDPWIALLLVDLDRFKEVNDTLGHDAGDRLLAAVGARLRTVLRPDQLLARLGGDEFAVVLPGVERSGAVRVASAMQAALVDPFEIDGTRLHVSASVGIATARPPRDDPTDLLRKADVAMYRAKRGGAGLAVYDPLRDHQGPERLRRIDELRAALDGGQLEVHLQPQVDLRGGQIIGAEALARWRHPQDGVLLPEDFLPLAAQTGLLRPVARLVLDQALAACLTWWVEGHRVPVSVNLTAEDLASSDVRELVEDALNRYALPGEALHVEITEDALLTDRTRVAELLQHWRADGVAVSIDDYGTGYSSLAYLRELPVDEVKLDQVFTGDLSRRTTATIVRHTIAMAHGLRLRVVAEGIEDETAARSLADLGCDIGQGNFFGSAMTGEAFLDLLRSRKR